MTGIIFSLLCFRFWAPMVVGSAVILVLFVYMFWKQSQPVATYTGPWEKLQHHKYKVRVPQSCSNLTAKTLRRDNQLCTMQR